MLETRTGQTSFPRLLKLGSGPKLHSARRPLHHVCSACADQESLQDVRQLPAPAVEQLLSMKPGAAIVGACPVGDALMGSALMAATSDGKLHCLWPSGARTSDMVRFSVRY